MLMIKMMRPTAFAIGFTLFALFCAALIYLSGREPDSASMATQMSVSSPQPQVTIGNKRYLFDVSDHSPRELEALLRRAEDLAQSSDAENDQLDIALVLHGPDVELFTKENYDKYKDIVDLAARLDAFDVIDFKVCQRTITSRGLTDSDMPAFMELVPFAPDEIERLQAEGYVTL
ncbi:MAG: DsrE family protein [Gammaproteobacteria bacterium]